MWRFAGPATAWTNAFLQPPAEHVLRLLSAATHHKPVADGFFTLFNNPMQMWQIRCKCGRCCQTRACTADFCARPEVAAPQSA